MRRFLLLLFIINTSIALGQVTPSEQNVQQVEPVQKSDLVGLDVNQLVNLGYGNVENINPSQTSPPVPVNGDREECFDAYIPVDPNTYTPVPRNDDGSLFIPAMGFTFSFCGSDYTSCYINTNGNISFGSGVAQYSPDGFPFGTPMVAPFWADVDTRNVGCGQAWYQIFPNYMIVSWEDVGWYNQQCSPLNTFQCIISDGTAAIIGVGNNIQFRYGDMEWTTGQASGGGPFGGFAATVGYNSGDNVNFEQVGRFNVDDSSYDGPFGANDGVHYLDFRCYVFDSGGGAFTLECNDISRSLDANCTVNVTAEEIAESISSGCSSVDLSIDISSFGCDDIGPNTVTITATSGGQTETCTALVTIDNGLCSAPSITQVGPFCEDDFPTILTATPAGGTWSPNAPGGTFDPSVAGPGNHEVTYTLPNACPTTTSIFITVNSNPTVSISPDPPEFCENEGFVELFGNGFGGDGVYTYSWSTPSGAQAGQSIFATLPGLYTLTISDGIGCTDEAFTNVVVNPVPLVVINDPGPICNSEIAVQLIGAPSGGTWTGDYVSPEGFIFPQNTPPGFTQVTYSFTNNFGCVGTATADIEIVISPDALAFNNGPFCEGQPIELFGNTNAPGVALYSWTGPGNYTSVQQNPIDATEPGAYLLEVTVDGCPSELVPTVVEVIASPDAIAFNNGPLCEGQIINLFGSTTSSGNDIDYQWSGPNGYVSFIENPVNATEAGLYELIITVDGCPSEATSTLVEFTAAPIAEADNTGPYCADDPITLTGSTTSSGTTITYSWTGPGGYVSAVQNPTDATLPGTYVLEINVDGCLSNMDNTEIVVNAPPTPTITGDNVFCEGENSLLDAGSGYTIYDWSTGDASQTTLADATGTISVTVTDANGCTGETSYNVTENSNPVPTITGDDAFCEGASVSLDAGGGYVTYVWSEGSGTQTIDVSTGNTYGVTVTDGNGCTGETQFTVTENSITPPAISGQLSFCEGGNTVLDAGPGYSIYQWSDGSGGQTLDVSTSGTFSVTVTDANDCTAEDEVDVIVNDNLTPAISGIDAFCEGSSSTLDAGNGYLTYEWSDGTINQTLDVDASGTYSVTVTDASGCTGEDEINITVNQNPDPTIAGSASFCSGFSTILDAGGGYDIYEWSDGSGGQTLEVSAGGTVGVTVTDANGCTGEASLNITESTSLNPNISGDLEYCIGGTTTLDAGGGFVLYEWSDGSGGQSITVNNPDDYTVTVTDVNGCSGETTVSVIQNDLPTVNITGNDPICTGENVTLDAGAGFDEYLWSNTSLNQTVNVSAGGLFSVTVTDANGCTNEASVNVQENQNPTPSITGNASFCTGETVTLDAGTFDQYEWNDGSGLSTLDISTGGTYSVIVTDANGCTGTDQFTVTQNQLPTPNITGDLDFCAGSSTTLNGPPGFDYEWSTGSVLQMINIDLPGNVGLMVTDANGCTGETSVTLIENPNPDPTITGSTTFCVGNSAIIDAGGGYTQYVWSDGSLNQTLEVTIEGNYSVTVTDANGCTGIAQTTITESQSLEPVIAGNTDICAGETSTLDAGSGFSTYLWSNGEITQSIIVNSSNDYTVIVSDSQGCTGETTVSFVVNQNPTAGISGLDTFCEGESSTLDAGAGYSSYQWSNGEVTQTINVTASELLTVTVTDANGCTDETQIDIIVNPNPAPQITGPSSFCSGNSATLDAGAGYNTYFWSTGEVTQSIDVMAGDIYSVTVSTQAGCTAETQVDVIENSSLTPVILGDLDFCEGDNSVLDAGSGYATYEWSTGEMTQTITVTQNGNYGVLVTDTDGCSGTSNVSITTFQNPEPIIAGSTTFCTGSFSTLDAGSYDSYLWSTGEIAQTIVVNTPGIYTVDVTDQNGCGATAFVDVTESTSLSPVISGLPAFCTGGTATLDAGAGFTTYTWSDGSIGQTLEVTIANDYSVTVSDASGCTGETTVSVVENAPPVAELTTGPTLCNTDAGGSLANLYDLIISGDNTGTWDDTDNSGALGLFDNLNFNGIPAGDYTFTYTTNSAVNPCIEVSYPIVVTILDCDCPDVSFNSIDPLCNSNGTLDLSSILNTSESGTWTIINTPGGANPAVVNGQMFNAVGADDGDYELQYQLSDMPPPGCSDIFSISIPVENEVFAGTANMPIDFCADESQLIILNDQLVGQDPNGVWMEVSGIPSQNGAFNAANGSFNIAGQNSGTYNFEYTLSPGGACPDDSEMVTVIVNELPIAIAGTSVELDCINPTLSLDASGSSMGPEFDIQWSGGVVIDGNENTISPTVNQIGFYTLTITNTQTGCSATDVVEVTESSDVPVSFAGNDGELTCDDTEFTLQAGGNTGPGFEVLWQGPSINSNNENDVNPVVSLSGVYILTITNLANGCVSSPDTVIISDNDEAPQVVIESPLSIDCNNVDIEIIGSASINDVSFEWFNGGQSIGNGASISGVNSPGMYTLVATDNLTGCSGSETIEVFENINYPTANAGTPQMINCYDPIVTLDGSGSQGGPEIIYTWSGPGITGIPTDVSVTANQAGTYTLSVLNNDNGCESFATVLVDENTTPPVAAITQPEQFDCTVDEVSLDGSGSSNGANYTYTWTDQQGNVLSDGVNLDVQSIGTYFLAVQDTDNGCITSTSIIVSENMNVPNSVDFIIENPNCYGDNDGVISVAQVLGGTAPYVYSINGEAFTTTAFYTELVPGSYDILLQDANGCEWDTTINIIQPAEIGINLGANLELEMGDSAIVTAVIDIPEENIDTIIWSPADLINCGNPECLEIGFSSFYTQEVSATLIDIYGCVDEDIVTVYLDREKRVFIPNVFSPNGDDNNQYFTIYGDTKHVVNINKFMVFNRWGELLFENFNFQPNNPLEGWDGTFRGEVVNPAVFVYLAEIEFLDGEVILYKGDVTLVK